MRKNKMFDQISFPKKQQKNMSKNNNRRIWLLLHRSD